jgi:hypothetical protein
LHICREQSSRLVFGRCWVRISVGTLVFLTRLLDNREIENGPREKPTLKALMLYPSNNSVYEGDNHVARMTSH